MRMTLHSSISLEELEALLVEGPQDAWKALVPDDSVTGRAGNFRVKKTTLARVAEGKYMDGGVKQRHPANIKPHVGGNADAILEIQMDAASVDSPQRGLRGAHGDRAVFKNGGFVLMVVGQGSGSAVEAIVQKDEARIIGP